LKWTLSQEVIFVTVGELASQSGLPASTIRYWEKVGVLPKAARVSGQRRYAPDALHLLALLRLAQACGFRLDEMRHLMRGFRSDIPASHRWQELAHKKQQELDDRIAQLNTMRNLVNRVLQCQCAELVDCGRIAASVLERS
jgi:MerR family redox-sensitive transcriptional activator SoxR